MKKYMQSAIDRLTDRAITVGEMNQLNQNATAQIREHIDLFLNMPAFSKIAHYNLARHREELTGLYMKAWKDVLEEPTLMGEGGKELVVSLYPETKGELLRRLEESPNHTRAIFAALPLLEETPMRMEHQEMPWTAMQAFETIYRGFCAKMRECVAALPPSLSALPGR